MNDFVFAWWKRNRGWPWPEDSYGLTPMFGEDGWCHSCGVPNREQTGNLTLERKGLTPTGAWVPNGSFDVICVDADLAKQVNDRFDVDLREVHWPRNPPGDAYQIVIPTVGESWFDPEEVRWAAVAVHGRDGVKCPDCAVWRWMPLVFDGSLPPLRINPPLGDVDVAASPERFGDGWLAFRQVLVRRELAELLARASPRDFKITEVEWAD